MQNKEKGRNNKWFLTYTAILQKRWRYSSDNTVRWTYYPVSNRNALWMDCCYIIMSNISRVKAELEG